MKFEEMRLNDFLNELASDSPAPGGGTVAALGAALGAALVSMVSNLTVGKEKYRDDWVEMEDVVSKSETLRRMFTRLMDEDTESFNAFMAAMKLPKETDGEKAARRQAMAEASKATTEVPLRTLEQCVSLGEIAVRAMKSGNPNTVSDAGSASLLACAAGRAAAYNVRINLPGVKDEAFATEVQDRMSKALDALLRTAKEAEDVMNKALN